VEERIREYLARWIKIQDDEIREESKYYQ